jgi:hypothetical protein
MIIEPYGIVFLKHAKADVETITASIPAQERYTSSQNKTELGEPHV